jgi:hypothetical protein
MLLHSIRSRLPIFYRSKGNIKGISRRFFNYQLQIGIKHDRTKSKAIIDDMKNLLTDSVRITYADVPNIVNFLRKNKVYNQIGINGLTYQPGPIHDIYCEIIKEDDFFINRVPDKYLPEVLAQMDPTFFTSKNLKRCQRITGETYNRFFRHIILYRITDLNGEGWPGCEMNSDDDDYSTYIAPEITLVTDPRDFLKRNKDWKGPHFIEQVDINHNAILESSCDCINVIPINPIKPKELKWITFMSCSFPIWKNPKITLKE